MLFFRTFLAAGCAALMAVGVAQAQFVSTTPEVPEAMRGTWASSQHCESGQDDFWVIGASADLFLPVGEANETLPMFYLALLADLPVYEGQRYFVDYGDGALDLVRAEGDRLVVHALPEDSAAATLDLAAVEATIEPAVFHRCPSLPVGLGLQFSELVTFLQSDTLSLCRSGGEACLAASFSFVDVAPDGELRPAELSRGMRILLLMALGLTLSQDGYQEEPYAAALAAMPLLPAVGFTLVAQVDFDGSGGVSLAEIGTDRAGLMPTLSQEDDFQSLAEKIPAGSLERLGALLRMMTQ